MTAIKPYLDEKKEVFAAKIMQTNHNHPKHTTKQGQSPIRCLLLLSMLGSGTLPLLALAQAQTSTSASPANREKVLRQRLLKAHGNREAARQSMSGYPVFQIQGTVEQSGPNAILVYGVSIAAPFTPVNVLGWTTEKSFLTVRNYNPNDLNGGRFYGMVMAISQREFTAIPAGYRSAAATLNKYDAIIASIEGELAGIEAKRQQERQRVVQAQKAKVDATAKALRESVQRQKAALAKQLIAQFQARYASDAATSSDSAFFSRYGQAAKGLYQSQILGKSAEEAKLYEPLRETAIVQLVKAATLLAKSGDLAGSGELLLASLWWNEDGLNGSEIYRAQSFAPSAQVVLKRQSALLGPLLEAWGRALPDFVERASYGEVVQTRKLAEVLARCAGAYNLPQRSVLLAGLSPKTLNGAATSTAEIPDAPPLIETPKAVAPKVVARRPALEFQFRHLKSGQNFRLSDFRGKVVVLLLGEFADDDFAAGPSRIERFFEYSKGYDASKVVFLCVISNLNRDYFQSIYKQVTDPSRAESGRAVRKYLDFYSINMSPDVPVFDFYNGRGDRYSGNRVTVIDAQGQIVGSSDFVLDAQRTDQNSTADRRRNRTMQNIVYDFDKDALDAQIIEALSTTTPKVKP